MTNAPATVDALPETAARRAQVRGLTVLFSAILLLLFFIQLPQIYAFDFCGFYDPGTSLKGAELLAKGYRPTIDFGYTHGLVSLELSRLWFALLGRTPAAYFALMLILECFIAWGLARLTTALRLRRRSIVLMAFLLPVAVVPNYLTLTHPLEAALIVHALAEHAMGRRHRSLALMTLCIFVKPSMAYVYGFLLLVLIAIDAARSKDVPSRVALFFRQLIPAAVTGVITASTLALIFGLTPLKNTVFAVAGTSAYKQTDFGLFRSGLNFLRPAPDNRTPVAYLWHYLGTPATIWIIAAIAVTALGAVSIGRYIRRRGGDPRGHELLFTLAALHLAFLLGFYGWTHSWTYYAYMPFFGLALIASLYKFSLELTIPLCVLAFCGQAVVANQTGFALALASWQWKAATPETGGLYAWTNVEHDQLRDFREVLAHVGNRRTLLMTNGYPTHLPPAWQLPDAWFPETGIATPVEVARVLGQVRRVEVVVIWREYGKLDLWNTQEFASERSRFTRGLQNHYFEVWDRTAASAPGIGEPAASAPTR